MDAYRNAIASIESAGSGNYQAIGPTHSTLGRALGRYQIMEANLAPWSQAALGRTVTADEFLANPQIQDAIFDNRFGGYVDKFGPSGAAQAWFAGPGGVGKLGRQDSLGTSVDQYTRKFNSALGNAPSQPSAPQGILSTNSPQMEAPQMDQEKATGLLGMLFPNMSADRQDRLAMGLSGLSMFPNQGVMQGAQQRMSDRRDDRKQSKAQAAEQQKANRTLEVLRQAGVPEQDLQIAAANPAYLNALLSNVAQQRFAKPERTKYEYNEDLGGFVDPYNPQAGVVNTPGGSGQPKIDVDGESKLRGEYVGRPDVKAFKQQADAFARIRAAAEQPDAAGDMALIFNYMKLLDPGSTVREGEFLTAQNAAGLDDRTRNVWNNLQTGQRLSPDQRQEFVNRAGRIYESARGQNSSTELQYQNTAQQYGFDPQRTIPDVNYQSPYAPQQTATPPTARPQPSQSTVQAPSEDQLRFAVSQLSQYDQQLMLSIPTAKAQFEFLRERGLLP